MSELLTVSEAARELRVSAQTVRQWADRGKLIAQRTSSGQRIFARDAVEQLRVERVASRNEAA